MHDHTDSVDSERPLLHVMEASDSMAHYSSRMHAEEGSLSSLENLNVGIGSRVWSQTQQINETSTSLKEDFTAPPQASRTDEPSSNSNPKTRIALPMEQ